MYISKTAVIYQATLPALSTVKRQAVVPRTCFSAYQPDRWAKLNRHIESQNPSMSEYIPHLFTVSPYAKLYHNQDLLLEALQKYGYDHKKIRQHLGDGKQTLAFELDEGVALRVMNTSPVRKRLDGIDLPVFDDQEITLPSGKLWIECQPIADINVSQAEQQKFLKTLRKNGLYPLQDFFTKGQLGRYQGRIYLIDPDCVASMEPKNAGKIMMAATCHKIARLFGCNTIYETPLYRFYRQIRLKQLQNSREQI